LLDKNLGEGMVLQSKAGKTLELKEYLLLNPTISNKINRTHYIQDKLLLLNWEKQKGRFYF
jgi:hypothetical protein